MSFRYDFLFGVNEPLVTIFVSFINIIIKQTNHSFFKKKKVFGGHMSFLGATGTPVWIYGDVSFGVQSQSGFCLICFCRGKCNVHSLRSTSGATLANLLAAGAQLVTSPHTCAEVGLGSDLNGQSPGQKTNALPLCQRPSCNLIIVPK